MWESAAEILVATSLKKSATTQMKYIQDSPKTKNKNSFFFLKKGRKNYIRTMTSINGTGEMTVTETLPGDSV